MVNDYFKHSDVLLMDSTYNTNKYNYPLVAISGCNSGGRNIYLLFVSSMMKLNKLMNGFWNLF